MSHRVKYIIGPNHSAYSGSLQQYEDPTVDQAGWEAAANEAGLRPVNLQYASEAEVSPGVQLFALASTLYYMGLYTNLGQPNGNAAAWRDQITA